MTAYRLFPRCRVPSVQRKASSEQGRQLRAGPSAQRRAVNSMQGRQLNAGPSTLRWRLPWSVCTTLACLDVCGTFLRTFSAGTLSQDRTGDSSSQPWVESGIAQGRVLFLSLFNVLVDTSAASVRSVAPFRNTCHRHGDEVVLVSESQVDLQAGLNACHAWGTRWRFTFGIGPTKSAAMIFGPAQSRPDCHVHLGGVPLLGVVLTPDLSWRAHVAHVSSCIDRLFHQSSA